MILLQIDPNTIRPGWTPLIITIVLAAVIALLMISMRRHMHRVDLPTRDEVAEAERAARMQAKQSASTESENSAADVESTPDQTAPDVSTAQTSTAEAVAGKAGQPT